MKRLKHKILIPTIAAISTLAIVAPLSVSISSKVVTTNTNNSSIVNSINYNTITYNTDKDDVLGEWTVTLAGPNKVKAEVGNPFGSIQRPKAVHSLNWKFKGWSTSRGDESSIVTDDTPVPAATTKWSLYPIFETPALLSNCLCISAIEATTVSIDFQTTPTNDINNKNRDKVDMSYSLDFGSTWNTINYTAGTTYTISMAAGDSLYLKGDNPNGLSTAADNFTHISFNNHVNLFGNAMGLVNNGAREAQKTKCVPNEYCFYHLFANDTANTAIEYVADNFFPCENYSGGETATLKAHCYEGAFLNCSGMVHAPRLFATTNAVIGDDDNDTTACYKDIFKGCSSVDFIRTRYDGLKSACTKDQFTDWVSGVKTESGTFIYNGTDTASNFGIPTTWTKYKCPGDGFNTDVTIDSTSPSQCTADHGYQFTATCKRGSATEGVLQDVYWISSNEQVASIDHSTGILTGRPVSASTTITVSCFSKANLNAAATKQVTIVPIELANCTSIKNPSSTEATSFGWTFVGTAPAAGYPTFKYTLDDGTTWLETTRDTDITIPAGKTLYLKGDNLGGLSAGVDGSYTQFYTTSGTIELGGSIVGLINNGLPISGDEVIPCDYCFSDLFASSNVTKVNSGFLPYKAGQLTDYCYNNMFGSCSKLTSVPSDLLPALTLTGKDGNEAVGCYAYMFNGSAITTAPSLPATTLSSYCYYSMFYNCKSLTATPALKATGAKEGCYKMMFQACSSATSFGKISLTSLADYCCYQIFASIAYAYENYTTNPGQSTEYTLIFKMPAASSDYTESTTRFLYKGQYNQYTPTNKDTCIYIINS